MNKRILGGLAAAVMLTGGLAFSRAGTASAAEPASFEMLWSNAQNQETFWENYFATDSQTVSCTASGGDAGVIDASVDAAVIKDGADVVKVYPDLTNVGTFTATGAINQANEKPFDAPHSWVMRCMFTPTVSGLTPPVLTASFDCVAESASASLSPTSSDEWSASDVTEDEEANKFSVTITPNGSYFAGSVGSITLTADYTETSACEATVAVPSLTPPSCQAAGSVAAVNTAKYTFGNVGNVYTATAVAGVRLVDQTVFDMQPLPKLNTGCSEVTQSEPPIPPAVPTNRPPTNRPSDVVAASSPAQAPPADVSALPPVVPAAGLPVTGIDGTGVTAIIALLLTSLGGAALFLSRRRSTTI